MTGVLKRRGSLDTDTYRGKTRYREMRDRYKPKRQASEETSSADTLISAF